jgi:hypothetical protein
MKSRTELRSGSGWDYRQDSLGVVHFGCSLNKFNLKLF